MLTELRVRELGVIADLEIVLGAGMTAITGETGAGKTLVIEALELLVGGRSDPAVVRAGAAEALVEGRFHRPPGEVGDGAGAAGAAGAATATAASGSGGEVVLARAIPANGRSRAWVDGRMVTASALAEVGAELVDIYSQHAHQSLVSRGAQRSALDRYAGLDISPVTRARERLAELRRRLDDLGGGERAIAREADLLRFQLREIEEARISGDGEDDTLEKEETLLASVGQLREAALTSRAHSLEAREALGVLTDALTGMAPLEDLAERAKSLAADAADIASELRMRAESFEDDPDRLAAVQARRRVLRELVRKYGATLGEVLEFGAATRARLEDLESAAARRLEVEGEIAAAAADLAAAEKEAGDVRRAAAPRLSRAVQANLRRLAMPGARLEVAVPPDGLGDAVEMLLAANAGEPAQPLARIASGGELARSMLAMRLVLTASPPTLVFDEVDAGIGGEAALAVGSALAELATRKQVLVVTHLAQVAAYAGTQVAVRKHEERGRTVVSAEVLDDGARVAELSRMLSGHPGSKAARAHAVELLSMAGHAGA